MSWFSNKTALITVEAQGLGLQMALAFPAAVTAPESLRWMRG